MGTIGRQQGALIAVACVRCGYRVAPSGGTERHGTPRSAIRAGVGQGVLKLDSSCGVVSVRESWLEVLWADGRVRGLGGERVRGLVVVLRVRSVGRRNDVGGAGLGGAVTWTLRFSSRHWRRVYDGDTVDTASVEESHGLSRVENARTG